MSNQNLDIDNQSELLNHLSCFGFILCITRMTLVCEVAQSCLTLCDPWTVAYQAPPSMGFSRQEYWSGLPFPSPEDLPHPRD